SGISGGSPLSAGGAFVQLARRFAIPALYRSLRNFHAGQPASRPRRAPGAAYGGGQTGLRLDFQPARKSLRASDTLPTGGREDGCDPPASCRYDPRAAVLSGFFRSSPIAQLLSGFADDLHRRSRSSCVRTGQRGGRGRKVPDFLSAISPKYCAVLVRRRYLGKLSVRVLGS